jgi:hypothetical protein
MRARTLVAVAVLAGLTFAPRCANRAGYQGAVIPSEARDLSLVKEEIPRRSAPRNDKEATPGNDKEAAPADPFRDTIRPILSARCGQCHDPGGRMYARLPFDNPQVVSSHSEGVLRRLKGEDRAAMEKWLAGLAPASGQR